MAGSAEYLIARKKFLLSGLDLAKLRGLEIGALASPRVEKNEGPIHYVDHATTADLITKYAGQIDPKRIRNVDYVWSPEAQLSSVVENEKFDYIVANQFGSMVISTHQETPSEEPTSKLDFSLARVTPTPLPAP